MVVYNVRSRMISLCASLKFLLLIAHSQNDGVAAASHRAHTHGTISHHIHTPPHTHCSTHTTTTGMANITMRSLVPSTIAEHRNVLGTCINTGRDDMLRRDSCDNVLMRALAHAKSFSKHTRKHMRKTNTHTHIHS